MKKLSLLFVIVITNSCTKNQVEESSLSDNKSPTLCECSENRWDFKGKYDETSARVAGTLVPRYKLASKYDNPVWYSSLTKEDKLLRDKCNEIYVETKLIGACK